MGHLVCPDCPPGMISAQVQIRASEIKKKKKESPRRAGGLCMTRRVKEAVKMTHLGLCQVGDDEGSPNPF